MKTGLLTFYHIHHYGAMLQAYATERAVASLGSECEIIDYYVNQDNTLFQRPTGLGSAAHDAHTALHYGPLKARYERFEAFSRENLNISGRRYQSLEELRQAELPYDVLLSGSDQIWNPKIFPDGRFDPVFFGAFSHKRKIAYAPSFGIPRIPDGMEEELRTYLERAYDTAPVWEYSRCVPTGWNIKYRKGGRGLCTLYPMRGYFTALVVIGRRERPGADLLLPMLSEGTRRLWQDTREGMGQKWLMIDVADRESLEDVKRLIALRRAPVRYWNKI